MLEINTEDSVERSPLSVLEDVKWISTTDGKMSPKEVFLSGDLDLNLSEDVVGYAYGAQYRFLMTIYALLAKEERQSIGKSFSREVIDRVFDKLAPHADLFSKTDPFLQVIQDDLDSFLEGDLIEPKQLPGKLLPEGQSPGDNQVTFWDLKGLNEHLPIQEAVLALVCYYFYGIGTNTKLSSEGSLKLNNGSSGLRYMDSIEIIPQSSGLMTSLPMSTPNSFLRSEGGELLPHWADRKGNTMTVFDDLWRFSWSSNTCYCTFSKDGRYLEAITRGGIPRSWSKQTPMSEGEKWAKSFHDERSTQDPLFFYRDSQPKGAEAPEKKLWRSGLSSDPYYSVAQWHFEELSRKLETKWGSNLMDPSELEDIVFLEHATEGPSNSFNIRHSKVVRGWREELMPKKINKSVPGVAANVMAMRRKLTGLFTEGKGTCQHLSPRQRDVEDAYWKECQSIIEDMIHEGTGEKEANPRIVKAAVAAFESVSSNRDSVNIKSHMVGLGSILAFKF